MLFELPTGNVVRLRLLLRIESLTGLEHKMKAINTYLLEYYQALRHLRIK